MEHKLIRFMLTSLAAGAITIGCTANIHDNTADIHDNTINIDDARLEFGTTANVDDIRPGQAIPITITAENVFLVEPGAAPPAAQAEAAGHFRVYLDDLGSTAILITAAKTFTVTIPEGTLEGPHKIHCRIHKHDGTATTATFELSITVKIAVASGTPDAG